MQNQIHSKLVGLSLIASIGWLGHACRTSRNATPSESLSASASSEGQDFEEARQVFNGSGPTEFASIQRGDAFILAADGRGKLMSEVLDQSRNSWWQKGETCIFEANHRIDIVGFVSQGDRALVLYHAPSDGKEQVCVDGSYFFIGLEELKKLEKCRQLFPQKNCINQENHSKKN